METTVIDRFRILFGASIVALLLSAPAAAQKGAGAQGMAVQNAQPRVVMMSGQIAEIDVGPCEQTTGRAATGVHLKIRTEDERIVKLHLGPVDAVDHILKQLAQGDAVSFEAFQTDAMPEGSYVAKSLTLDGRAIQLRDDNLRPSWAGARGTGRGLQRSGGCGW